MRSNVPTSRTRLFSRPGLFDVLWALASPVFAFLIRDGSLNRIDVVSIYCATALVTSLVVFQWFKTGRPIAEFFSFHDAFALAKACLTTAALTAVILFVLTRLDDAPRSIPVIHFLVLGGGLIGVRAIARFVNAPSIPKSSQPHFEQIENILIVGATRLALFFIAMLEEFAFYDKRVVAIVDRRRSVHHRTINGYPIIGSPSGLSKIIDEYANHGVKIGKVVIANEPKHLTGAAWIDICEACKSRDIPIEWLHEKFSLPRSDTGPVEIESEIQTSAPPFTDAFYWKTKRMIDVSFALVMMVALAPVTILVAALVWIDVGVPVVFWQQRLGRFGRPLHVYKFRTMRSSYDRNGHFVPEGQRLSSLGYLLRRNRLDEIPQLFNILLGTMSVIGPRPLLPIDQPKTIRYRLQVNPGLTGLAQISGGTLLSPEEKDALDEWYVRHATLVLDLKILIQTVWVIVRGERRNESEIAKALEERKTILEIVT